MTNWQRRGGAARGDLYIAGVASWFPKPVPVEEAIADGRYDTFAQERSGQRSVAVADEGESQPEMAVLAGRAALERSGHSASEVALLLHAVAVYSGLEGWNCASYLQHQILDEEALSFEVRQVSNGAVASIELAAAFLDAAPERPAALITAAEQFGEPAWDRWRADSGLVFGDGASAVLLSRVGGFARIVATATTSAPQLEGLHRGDAPFKPCPDPADYPLDLHSRALQFTAGTGVGEVRQIGHEGLRRAVDRAVFAAGMTVDDAAWYVMPNFGSELLRQQCLEPLGIPLERTTWQWGSTVGHVGAADQFGGLDHLVETGAVGPGDRVLLVGVGGGFNWTCVVVEILDTPAWAGGAG